jgi:hypothetical protein
MDCRLDKSVDLLQVSTPITPDGLIQIKLTLGSQLIAEIACLVIGVNNRIHDQAQISHHTSFQPVIDSCASCKLGLLSTGFHSDMKPNEPRALNPVWFIAS